MPTFAEITNDTARVEVVYNGHPIQVEYKPSLVTEKAIGDLLRMAGRGEALAATPNADAASESADLAIAEASISDMESFTGTLNALLARVMCWWDVTENGGAMYPLTTDRLAETPLALRQQLLAAIFGDLRLGGMIASVTPRRSQGTLGRSKRTTSKKRA